MAGAKTHLVVAAVGGGVTVIALLMAGQVAPREALLCFTTAALGGLLPDLDSGSSTPLAIAFTLFAIVFSFLVTFSQVERLSLMELLVLWLAVYLFFKLVVFRLISHLTTHRGIFHSVPAAVLYGVLTTVILSRVFGLSSRLAWLAGVCALLGAVSHLLLDELYGLNPFGAATRTRVGGAFKFFSREWVPSLLIYLAVVGAVYIAPSWPEELGREMPRAVWKVLRERMMPRGGEWFGYYPAPLGNGLTYRLECCNHPDGGASHGEEDPPTLQ